MGASRAPVLLALLLTGCATFQGPMEGRYEGPEPPAAAPGDASVLFVLRHVRQARGLDAIPKLLQANRIIRDFDNLFVDAASELFSVGAYATFTEFPSDVSDPERIARRDSLMGSYDYVVRITLLEEYSFVRHFFSRVVSALSLTVVPMPYGTRYAIDAELLRDGAPVASYRRSSSKTLWVQALLLFVQPFHADALVKERITIDLLHDVFRQMQADGVLQ